MRLGDFATAQGFRLESLGAVASTNDEAMARARAGDGGRLWIVGESQQGGRGRQGRPWVSPPGNLYASLLLIEPCDNARAAELGFVAGVALADGVRQVVGQIDGLGLKWPNDLVCNGAKISGMLLEATRLANGALAVVIGIGVNCASSPQGLAYPTLALRELAAEPARVDRQPMFAALSDALARWLVVWRRGDNFAGVRTAWLEACIGLGRPIKVARGTAIVEGTFKTIDATGRLIVAETNPDGRETNDVAIDAGDVLLGAARP